MILSKCGKAMLLGGTGRLGKEILAKAPNLFAPTHKQMDILKKDECREVISKYKPECIVHTVALTNVVECQNNKNLAWEVNVSGTKNLVSVCKKIIPKTKFIYISTPSVFDCMHGGYTEDSTISPTNYYGFTKAIAEQVVQCMQNYHIIRTNFVPRTPWAYEGAFADRFGTYLYADQVAEYLLTQNIKPKIFHLCGSARYSMYDVACKLKPEVKKIYLNEDSFLNKNMSLCSRYHKGVDMK